MRVYYEKPDGLKVIADAISLAEKYESATGKKPNRVSMTQEEFDALDSYFAENYHWYKTEKEKHLNISVAGMKVIINDN